MDAAVPASRDAGRLFIVAILLTAIGLAAVYSASAVTMGLDARIGDASFLLRRQAIWACAGILAMLSLSAVPPAFWVRSRWLVLAASFALLLLVYVPGLGIELNGARRWVRVAGHTFQPSEFAKLGLLLFVCAHVARDPDRLRRFGSGFVPAALAVVVAAGLVGSQPDVGSAVVLVALLGGVLYVAGARVWHLAVTLVLTGLGGSVILATKFPHVSKRIAGFLGEGEAYQVHQSLIAIGSGGLHGEGLGGSVQKLYYLPEAHSDFVFPIFAEELGFLGGIGLLLLYAALAATGWRVCRNAPDTFGRLFAFGVTLMILLGVLVNLGVATALLPAKGAPLPFLSSGGSSLIVNLAAVGVLMSISSRPPAPERLEG